MRFVTVAPLAVAVILLAACDQQTPDATLTAPDAGLSFGKAVGGLCNDVRARLIATQQGNLWTQSELREARTLFDPVIANCAGNLAAARSYMLDYIQWTIDHRAAIVAQPVGTTKDGNLLLHWNTVFPYVGYTGQDQPSNVPDSVFRVGAARVIDGDVTDSLSTSEAAITVYAQNSSGDQRDHLVLFYPIASNCLTGSNLRQSGPCFEFSAFPHVNPGFSPKVKVGICQDLHEGDAHALSTPALGHLAPTTRVTDNTNTYPNFCDHLAAMNPAGSWNDGFGSVVKRLAWHAKRSLTPQPLYAVHGGLGGFGTLLSPFGAVDREVFHATFTGNSIGLPPSAPEAGSWVQQLKAPGTILVASSLGQRNNRLVVLQQAGGNCANCFGLLLQGNLATAGPAATDGVYDAEWISLQAQTNMKEAVFALRDSAGRDIARVTYAVRSNKNLVLYNDVRGTPGTFITNWVQNVPRHFRIRVDLDNKTTSLWLDGVSVTGATNIAFVNSRASNFASISADFRGIDSGTIGWDEIRVERQPDTNH